MGGGGADSILQTEKTRLISFPSSWGFSEARDTYPDPWTLHAKVRFLREFPKIRDPNIVP